MIEMVYFWIGKLLITLVILCFTTIVAVLSLVLAGILFEQLPEWLQSTIAFVLLASGVVFTIYVFWSILP